MKELYYVFQYIVDCKEIRFYLFHFTHSLKADEQKCMFSYSFLRRIECDLTLKQFKVKGERSNTGSMQTLGINALK